MGLNMTELDRDLSLCGHAINDPSNVVKIVILEMMRGFDNPTSSYWEANVVLRRCHRKR
jgi:hypothetical protein